MDLWLLHHTDHVRDRRCAFYSRSQRQTALNASREQCITVQRTTAGPLLSNWRSVQFKISSGDKKLGAGKCNAVARAHVRICARAL